MNLFLKGNSYPVISIGKFPNQLYVTTQSKKAISNRCLFQRLNSSRVVLRTNTCRAKKSYYASRRVVRINHSENIIRLSEMYLIFIKEVKCKVHVTFEIRDYTTSVVYKNNLTDFSSVSNPTLVVSKCSDVIPCKFKAVKFTIE